jgi:CIC family chloride channel protein
MNGGILKINIMNDYVKVVSIIIPMGFATGLFIVGMYHIYEQYSLQVTKLFESSFPLSAMIPIVGITAASILVGKISYGTDSSGGSHRLLEAYYYEGGRMTLRDALIEPVAAAVTIGSGGSAGFEGPGLLLGGGIGSIMAQMFGLSSDEMRVLLISGAAAGMSAVFKAPLTGIMFALEIPYKRDLLRKAFIPATISSITAYITAIGFLGTETLFPVIPENTINATNILHALAIGLLSALVGSLFVKTHERLHSVSRRFYRYKGFYPIVAGTIIGVTGFYFPQVIGLGYETLKSMVHGDINSPGLLLSLILLKIVLTCVTLNFGGSGGVFIPTLFVGAAVGSLYNAAVPNTFGSCLIVASMAASISAANKTLLTSVAFVAETTGPSTIITTLIAAATSYFVSGGVSFYEDLQRQEELQEDQKAVNVLLHLFEKDRARGRRIDEIKASDFVLGGSNFLMDSTSVEEALRNASHSGNTEFPVVRNGRLVGSITLEELIESSVKERKKTLGQGTVGQLKLNKPSHIAMNGTLKEVVSLLVDGRQDNIYVVDDIENMGFMGVISEDDVKSKLLEIIELQKLPDIEENYEKK